MCYILIGYKEKYNELHTVIKILFRCEKKRKTP